MVLESPTDSPLSVPRDTASPQRSAKKTLRVPVIAILGLAIIGSFGFGFYSRPTPVRLAATNLEFGDTWATPDFRWVVTLENPSRQDVSITRFQSTCRCTSISPETLVIPAGGTAPISLNLDLTPTGAQGLVTPVRPFEVSISAAVDGSNLRQGPWLVKGAVRPPFTASNQEVRFSKLLVQGEPFSSSSVTIRPSIKASHVQASCPPELATTVIRELPDDAFSLEVTPSTSLPVGPFSFPITISIDDETGEKLPKSSITARGEIVADIYALPPSVDYSILAPNTKTTTSIVIQTHLGTEFRVVEMASEDPELQTRFAGDQAFSTRQHVEVLGTLSRAGTYKSEISLVIETKDGMRRQLRVPVSGYVVTR